MHVYVLFERMFVHYRVETLKHTQTDALFSAITWKIKMRGKKEISRQPENDKNFFAQKYFDKVVDKKCRWI